MGVINETRVCRLIANGSGYSFVCNAGGVCKSQRGPSIPQPRLWGKRMLSASPCFSLSSHRRPQRPRPSAQDRDVADESQSACVASSGSPCYVSGLGGALFGCFVLGFFPISFIWNHCCKLSGPVPWEGRREARFGARFQPTGFLPFSPLITARAMHACARHFSHLLASLTILPANKGWTQFPVEPVNVAAELPGDSQREAFLPSLLLSVLGPSSWARFSQVKPYWLHWLHWIYLGLHQCIREQDLA